MEQKNEFNPYAAPIMAEPIEAFGSQQTLQQVAAGFNLIYFAIVTVLLSIIIIVFAAAVTPALGPGAGLVAVIAVVGILAGGIMDLVGKCLCLAVPQETGTRPLITGSVVCLVAWILTVLVAIFLRSPYMQALVWVLGFASMLLFLIFVKRIAEFLNRRDMMDRAQTVIVLNIVMSVMSVLFNILTPFMGIDAVPMLIIGGIALIVLFIVYVVLYARLLVDSRKAILGVY